MQILVDELLTTALKRQIPHLSRSLDGKAIKHLIDHTYVPIFQWINDLLARNHSSKHHKCTVIGLSCVQGGGKTTACSILKAGFNAIGKKCAVISLDDVYMSNTDQVHIAKENSDNPLLQYRGNPGTHDLRLLLDFVRECKQSTKTIPIPAYDKSCNQGRGDRVPVGLWNRMKGPLDVLLIEGWCLGFQAVESIQVPSKHLVPINLELKKFELLYRELNGLILFRVSDLAWVYRWREEQEAAMRTAKKPSLTSAQVKDFVDRYMPSYHLYLEALYNPPKRIDRKHEESLSRINSIPRFVIDIDENRMPLNKFFVE